jgi:eukaryotic-like serine/threonine-protein kinase
MSIRSKARRSLPYAIAVIGGFLAAYLIVAFVVFPSGVLPRDVRVPNVIGLQYDDAVRQLANNGLRGVRGEERTHDAAPKGTVLAQDPIAGSRDVQGTTVELAVSIGPTNETLPPVTAPDTGGRT